VLVTAWESSDAVVERVVDALGRVMRNPKSKLRTELKVGLEKIRPGRLAPSLSCGSLLFIAVNLIFQFGGFIAIVLNWQTIDDQKKFFPLGVFMLLFQFTTFLLIKTSALEGVEEAASAVTDHLKKHETAIVQEMVCDMTGAFGWVNAILHAVISIVMRIFR